MAYPNIFEDDWRNCLRAHYYHVIRERDANNERSLVTVLKQTGFTEVEIDALRTQVLIELGWYDPSAVEAASVIEPEEEYAELQELPVEALSEPVIEDSEPEAQDVPLEDEKPPMRPKKDNTPPPVQMSLF